MASSWADSISTRAFGATPAGAPAPPGRRCRASRRPSPARRGCARHTGGWRPRPCSASATTSAPTPSRSVPGNPAAPPAVVGQHDAQALQFIAHGQTLKCLGWHRRQPRFDAKAAPRRPAGAELTAEALRCVRPSRRARSRSRPGPKAGWLPAPSSSSETAARAPSRTTAKSTRLARAWRSTLVSPSCTARRITAAVSAPARRRAQAGRRGDAVVAGAPAGEDLLQPSASPVADGRRRCRMRRAVLHLAGDGDDALGRHMQRRLVGRPLHDKRRPGAHRGDALGQLVVQLAGDVAAPRRRAGLYALGQLALGVEAHVVVHRACRRSAMPLKAVTGAPARASQSPAGGCRSGRAGALRAPITCSSGGAPRPAPPRRG